MSREKKHGVDWAKELQDYAKCLNNEKREKLAWKSPFEIYFGHKSYDLVNPGLRYEGKVSTLRSLPPNQKDVKARLYTVNKWRESANKSSKRMDNRMMKSHARKDTYKLYEKGDEVYVKQAQKRRKSTKHFILEGTIEKRYTDDASYKVKLKNSSKILRKIRVENLADFPSQDNSRKKIAAVNRRRKEQ